MWGRKREKPPEIVEETPAQAPRLKDAIRQARIETAVRTGVVVDLRDAEMARLELLNDGIDTLFAEIPPEVDLFDRGVSKGEVPRLWIDVIAYVVMGRDKRTYRFVQDTRFGRKVLLETQHIPEMVEAITRYVAGRMVERERALANTIDVGRAPPKRSAWRTFGTLILGIMIGVLGLMAAVVLLAQP